MQFCHNALHASALLTDAGTDRIDHGIAGVDGDLGAAARLACDGLDRHNAACNLGHFHLKEALDEIGMNAGDADLRGVGIAGDAALHFQDIDLDMIALAEFLAGDHLALFQNAFRIAQLDIDIVVVLSLYNSGQDFVGLFHILVIDLAALCLADALHDHLLGCQCSHAQEAFGRDILFDDVVNLGARTDFLCVSKINLCGGIGDLIHHQHTGIHIDRPADAVHSGHDTRRGNDILGQVALVRHPDGFLNRCIQHIHTDVFFMCQSFHSLDDF